MWRPLRRLLLEIYCCYFVCAATRDLLAIAKFFVNIVDKMFSIIERTFPLSCFSLLLFDQVKLLG